jgi:hypothetical protein
VELMDLARRLVDLANVLRELPCLGVFAKVSNAAKRTQFSSWRDFSQLLLGCNRTPNTQSLARSCAHLRHFFLVEVNSLMVTHTSSTGLIEVDSLTLTCNQ